MKKLKKKDYFSIHSWIGVQLCMLFFIVCFSGTIAVFSHELDWLFNPEMRAVPQEKLASKNDILQQIKTQYPEGNITFWMKSHEDYLCDIIYLEQKGGKRLFLFANQYTGKLQGAAATTIQRFFRDLHYYLFIPFQIGHFLVLSFAFLLLGSLISGWKFMRKKKKHFLNLGKKNNTLAYHKNLHKTFGLWSIPFVLLFSITGIWYFSERVDLFSISNFIGDKKIEVIPSKTHTTKNFSYSLDYDSVLNIAKKEIPNFTFGSFVISNDNTKPIIEVRGKSDMPMVRYRANRVVIDTETDTLLYVQKATETNTLKTINNMIDPIHFGHFGGLFTKAIWFVFGLMITYLTASGIWIYLKRISKNKKGAYTFRYVNWFLFAVMQFFMYQRLIYIQGVSLLSHIIILVFWSVFLYLIYSVFYKKIRT
ncbi:PepSY-associated TM helix domain-containing protein [Polaribacter cellanae]|uniref:PepSY domain-containing protein n=1 Tax=Polaribacter cellanae TaxID=2818493 RepID=A0A975CQQ1_9FLAO|nr:PepSY-associated TM helix domain-containing protein [Polaribacter cellanae]QTE24381.1 PepSY domain-containing protein [Polaribacter cellanae]